MSLNLMQVRGLSLSFSNHVHDYFLSFSLKIFRERVLNWIVEIFFAAMCNRSTSFLQPFQKLKWTYFTEPEEPLFFYGAPTQPAQWGDILRSPEPRSLGLFSRELWVSLMSRVMRGSTPGGGVTWDTSGDWPDSPEPGTIRVYNGDFLHPLREKAKFIFSSDFEAFEFIWLLRTLGLFYRSRRGDVSSNLIVR